MFLDINNINRMFSSIHNFLVKLFLLIYDSAN